MVTRARLNVRRRRRRILWLSVVAVAITLIVAVSAVLVLQQNSGPSGLVGQAISPALYQELAGVSDSTLSAVGSGQQINAPTLITGTPLTSAGKPEVLYIGGDFCPYCAVERWSMIIALSRFGSFSNIQYMLSSSTDVFPNTPTFTFRSATYSSQYISFVAVEQFGRGGVQDVKQPPTPDQQALVSQYDSQSSIPFIDFANSYTVVGAQVRSPDIVRAGNWSQVASQLNDPSSPIAKNVDAAANYLISVICKIDGGKPSAVCGQSYAVLPVSYHPPQGVSQSSAQRLTTASEDRKWTA